MARSSLAWNESGRLRDLVEEERPAVGLLEEPLARRAAPVNAPRTWPKSSLSSSVSVMAAQLTGTNGRSARRLLAWTALATSSLPVPLSPVIRTVASVGAILTIRPRTSRTACERPMMFSNL